MSKKIDTVFVLALITLFAATALALILIGAKQYRFVTNAMTENHEERTTSSYIVEKIRQNDTSDAILVCELSGIPALSITNQEEDICYTTYIYYYDGFLRELVVTDASVFSLSSGQAIIEMQGFYPEIMDNSLLRTKITDTNGDVQTLYFSLHCSIGKEKP